MIPILDDGILMHLHLSTTLKHFIKSSRSLLRVFPCPLCTCIWCSQQQISLVKSATAKIRVVWLKAARLSRLGGAARSLLSWRFRCICAYIIGFPPSLNIPRRCRCASHRSSPATLMINCAQRADIVAIKWWQGSRILTSRKLVYSSLSEGRY